MNKSSDDNIYSWCVIVKKISYWFEYDKGYEDPS